MEVAVDPFRRPGPLPRTTWTQPTMYPPNIIRVEFVAWLDGAMGRLTWGWAIADGEELQLVAMEAKPARPLDDGMLEVGLDFRTVLQEQFARLSPF